MGGKSCTNSNTKRAVGERTNLHGHVNVGRNMKDLLDCAVISFAKLFVELKLVHIDGKFGTGGKIDTFGMEDSLAVEIEGTGGIA